MLINKPNSNTFCLDRQGPGVEGAVAMAAILMISTSCHIDALTGRQSLPGWQEIDSLDFYEWALLFYWNRDADNNDGRVCWWG